MKLQRYQLFVTQIFLCLPIHIPNYLHFHSLKLWRRNRGSKDFRWHPDKNFDIIKTRRAGLPICMIFYSIKLLTQGGSLIFKNFSGNHSSIFLYHLVELQRYQLFVAQIFSCLPVHMPKLPTISFFEAPGRKIAGQRIFGGILTKILIL